MNNLLAVFIGGGIGSVLRYAISLLFANNSKSFPTATFITNLLACIILGVVVGFLFEKQKSSTLFVFLSVGLCGGFSTFSTFSLEGMRLIQAGNIPLAIGYAMASLVLGTAFIYLGFLMGQKFMI